MKLLEEQYPEMKPFVCKKYEKGGKHSLLVIGESHYLPNGNIQHLDPQIWYAGNSKTLDEKSRGWICTSDIIQEVREMPNHRPYAIYKNGLMQINKLGPQYDNFTDVLDDIVYYNFFLRPALQGDSLKVAELDVKYANEHFVEILKEYDPKGIVFLSSKAAQFCQELSVISIPVAKAPHPGCRWWNKKCAKYGNRYGRDVVADAVSKMWA